MRAILLVLLWSLFAVACGSGAVPDPTVEKTVISSPRVAVDGNGNGLVVAYYEWFGAYSHEASDETAIFIDDYREEDGGWSFDWPEDSSSTEWLNHFLAGPEPSAGPIAGAEIPYYRDPAVAMDATGAGIVVWAQYIENGYPEPPGYRIYASHYDPTAVPRFTAPERIDTYARWAYLLGFDSVHPQVSMDGHGNAMVVWAYGRYVFARRYDAATGWQDPPLQQLATESDGESNSLQVAMVRSGGAIAAWRQTGATFPADNFLISAAVFDPSTSAWGQTERIGHGRNLHLATEPNGYGVLVWEQTGSPPAGSDIHVKEYHFQELRLGTVGWQADESIESNDHATRPRVATNVWSTVVVWEEPDSYSGPTGIFARHKPHLSAWSAAEVLDSGDGSAVAPFVASDRFGRFTAVWRQQDAVAGPPPGFQPEYHVYARSFDRTWGNEIRIESGRFYDVGHPRVAAHNFADAPSALTIAVWDDGFGGGVEGGVIHSYVPGHPVASFTHQPTAPTAGSPVDFDASASFDPGGAITLYEWDFDDDSVVDASGADPHTTHTFHSAGDHVVRLTVTGASATSDTTRTITVVDQPLAAGSIVFASYRDGDFELYTMDPDGSNVTQLTDNTAADLDPVWSPGKTHVAFVSDRDSKSTGHFDLYVLEIATGTVEQRTFYALDFISVRDPAWSPDGAWIAYSFGDSFGGGIELVSPDGLSNRTLAWGPPDRWPAWSPGSDKIVITRGGDLYHLDPALDHQQTPTLMLDRPEDAESPAWSPDGLEIAYAGKGVAEGIHVLTISGGAVRRLTTDSHDSPCWSPDSGHLAFVWTTAPTGPRVCTMPEGGGAPTEVPGQTSGNDHPDWK